MSLRIEQIAAAMRAAHESTKKAACIRLKADGQKQTMAPMVLAEITRQDAARTARNKRKKVWASLLKPKATTPAERLQHLRVESIRASFRATVRTGAAGGDMVTVRLTSDPAEVGYAYLESREYPYKGNYKTYSAVCANHKIVAPIAWRIRVRSRGLARLDGLFTLDAAPLDSPVGVELYAASWVEQGRGYSCHTGQGVIAVRRGADGQVSASYHGADVRRALSGLARKASIRTNGLGSAGWLGKRVERNGERWIPLSLVKEQGACIYGIRSWCNRVGLTGAVAAGGATVAEVYRGYVESPAPEARRALVTVLRSRAAAQ